VREGFLADAAAAILALNSHLQTPVTDLKSYRRLADATFV